MKYAMTFITYAEVWGLSKQGYIFHLFQSLDLCDLRYSVSVCSQMLIDGTLFRCLQSCFSLSSLYISMSWLILLNTCPIFVLLYPDVETVHWIFTLCTCTCNSWKYRHDTYNQIQLLCRLLTLMFTSVYPAGLISDGIHLLITRVLRNSLTVEYFTYSRRARFIG